MQNFKPMNPSKRGEMALTKGMVLSLTQGGDQLGTELMKALPTEWEHFTRAKCKQNGGINEVVSQWFHHMDAFVFIGASGIAVRVIAPHLKDKFSDPAVIVIDEKGQHIISLLSGHIGGANQLAKTLAGVLGGTAVITTATDVNDRAGMDLVLKALGCPLEANRTLCLEASRQIIGGAEIGIWVDSDFLSEVVYQEKLKDLCLNGLRFYSGENLDVFLNDPQTALKIYIGFKSSQIERVKQREASGVVVPKVFALGTGSRKQQDTFKYQAALKAFLELSDVAPEAIACLVSVDLKAEEACMLTTAEHYGWETCFYSVERLKSFDGQFTCSKIVFDTLGLRAVSGPAAMCAARLNLADELYGSTFKSDGSTFTLGRINK